jgi:chitinase
VSYDDKETFKQKKDFAKELGLGGFLIWAIDQDDDQLAALQAVLDPKPVKAFAMTKGDENWTGSNEMCYVTECDGKCKSGYIKITDQKCAKNKKSQLCCPLSGAPDPKECHWRGDPLYCNGRCHDDEVMTHMSKFGDGGAACTDGQKAHCCKSPLAEENTCFWRGVGQQCPAGYEMMTFSGTAFDLLDDIAAVIIQVVGSFHPLTRLTGRLLAKVLERIDIRTKKLFCCKTNDIEKWDNCDWYGKPGNCFDGHCPDMRFVQLTDSYFGGDSTCGVYFNRRRVFCCQPKNGQPLFLPVPLENLFPNPPQGDSVDTEFELKTDKESAGGNTDPNDAAFQFYILASPEAIQQSLDKRDGSHWEVFDCKDAVTEGEHKVKMVCTDTSENSNCYKIGLGHGVPGTILQMPRGCGPGKYAVAKSLEPLPVEDHRKILPRHLAHLADSKPVVYELTFDYDFSRVPRDLGDTKLRVDFSNQDDYWNTIVAGAASKKKRGLSKRTLADVGGNHVRWLEEEFRDDYHFGGLDTRELHERWFGSSVIEWLVQLLKPEIKREFHYKYEDSITAKILDESWQCKDGDVGYEGRLLAQALLNVNVETSFGFTLIVESLRAPLNISQSYLTFYNKGEITGILTLEAVAKIIYEKKGVIANIPFPGATFRIPGIATIGPQITVEGGIDALFAVGGIVETKLEIAKWEVCYIPCSIPPSWAVYLSFYL